MRSAALPTVDIVMLGSFGVWTRGTLQARALPYAREVSTATGLTCALVTTPWDDHMQAGVHETSDGVAIYNTKSVNPSQALQVVREQFQLLQLLQPRLVHVMKPKAAAGLTADLMLRLGQRPRVCIDYDDWEGDGGWNDHAGYPFPTRRLFAYQERHLLRRGDAVTVASTLLQHRALQLREGSRHDSVMFLPNGLSREWSRELQFAATAIRNWDKPRLVLYSRFAEFSLGWLGKVLQRVDGALDAPVDLEIIGDTGESQATLGTLRRITPHWHGYVERKCIPELLGAATIALYPYDDNLINRSKQSVKLLELMASGCALVASDVGDIRRIGGTALQVAAPGDARAFAAAVVELCMDSNRAAELGRAAQRRAAGFTIDRLAGRLAGFYERFGLA